MRQLTPPCNRLTVISVPPQLYDSLNRHALKPRLALFRHLHKSHNRVLTLFA